MQLQRVAKREKLAALYASAIFFSLDFSQFSLSRRPENWTWEKFASNWPKAVANYDLTSWRKLNKGYLRRKSASAIRLSLIGLSFSRIRRCECDILKFFQIKIKNVLGVIILVSKNMIRLYFFFTLIRCTKQEYYYATIIRFGPD